jgi:hypothetical protein
MHSIIVVILRHARTPEQDVLWKRCHASVREFHPDIPIVVISDNSTYPLEEGYPNTTFITSEFPGAGELLPYYYFLQHKWAERMVFLHDSMMLIRPLNFAELEKYPVRFLWYFDNHQWDDNSVIVPFIQSLPNNAPLLAMHANTAAWDGCFGVASTIRLDFLEQLEKDYAFFTTLVHTVRTRDHRMAMERVFAIAVFTILPSLPRNEHSLCGRIHDMPFRWSELTAQKIEILKHTYPFPIVKSWHSR